MNVIVTAVQSLMFAAIYVAKKQAASQRSLTVIMSMTKIADILLQQKAHLALTYVKSAMHLWQKNLSVYVTQNALRKN